MAEASTKSFLQGLRSIILQEDGLVCNRKRESIATIIHGADNCIDQYVPETRSQDGSDQKAQFCSELEKIDTRLAGISSQRSQLNMPLLLMSEAKEEIGQSSSGDGVDLVVETASRHSRGKAMEFASPQTSHMREPRASDHIVVI
ncbi:uncharacterized protein LOC122070923 isoform X2 [Macadamia integrifolia]|uniref:uncharacterized protein LOC122070923 isoform X2 n=1 Tax=Macadamia integrifolia TaxID=60698 RepID=UPI001C4EFE9A|nr:uncharacterized protein LOC122070923 isoform X2 [Macadamia integrifolia]